MTSRPLFTLFIIFGIAAFVGCRSEPPEASSSTVEAVELEEYETAVSHKDVLVAQPIITKYDNATNHLFVHDIAQQKVVEITDSGEIAAEYGGAGGGPGEIRSVGSIGNFFITDDHFYILDQIQFFIHKYDRNGQPVSSLDYGELLMEEDEDSDSDDRQIPAPPTPPINDVNNEPFVTLNGNILIPSLPAGRSLYTLINWEGQHLADIGEIPEGYDPAVEDEQIRTALENLEVPVRDLHRAFPVNDPANPEELFLVYGAIPKIAKYNMSGEKLWERMIPATPEVDSFAIDIYDAIESRPQYLPPVRKYAWGTASPDGELYLSTFTHNVIFAERPLWVHRFNPKGELMNRYKIISENTPWYYPAFDFNGSRIFVVSLHEGDILAYPF